MLQSDLWNPSTSFPANSSSQEAQPGERVTMQAYLVEGRRQRSLAMRQFLSDVATVWRKGLFARKRSLRRAAICS